MCVCVCVCVHGCMHVCVCTASCACTNRGWVGGCGRAVRAGVCVCVPLYDILALIIQMFYIVTRTAI